VFNRVGSWLSALSHDSHWGGATAVIAIVALVLYVYG
jgi:hypothetical protein